MKFTSILGSLLIATACASTAQSPATGTPEGQAFKHRGVELTLMGNISLVNTRQTNNAEALAQQQSKSAATAAPEVVGRIGHYEVRKAPSTQARPMNAGSASSIPATAIDTDGYYIGVVYFNSSKEMGLIGREIALKFKNNRIPASYQHLGLRELVPQSGLYLLTVKDLAQWISILPQLEADPQVSLVEASIVTKLRSPR